MLLIIILLLVFGVGGGYYGYGRWGSRGGAGIGLGVFCLFCLSPTCWAASIPRGGWPRSAAYRLTPKSQLNSPEKGNFS